MGERWEGRLYAKDGTHLATVFFTSDQQASAWQSRTVASGIAAINWVNSNESGERLYPVPSLGHIDVVHVNG